MVLKLLAHNNDLIPLCLEIGEFPSLCQILTLRSGIQWTVCYMPIPPVRNEEWQCYHCVPANLNSNLMPEEVKGSSARSNIKEL